MTIASALTALNTDIQNARTAITNKGGTVTPNGGSSQLATDIGTITELIGEERNVSLTNSSGVTYRPSIDKNAITSITVTPRNQPRTVIPTTSTQTLTVDQRYSGNGTITVNPVTAEIDANIVEGNIKKDVQILGVTGVYEGDGYKELPSYEINNGVVSCRNHTLTGDEFNEITSVNAGALFGTFYQNTTLSGVVDLSSLTTVGQNGMNNAFRDCTGITGVDLSSLTTVDVSGLQGAFQGCTSLTGVVDLSSLTSAGNGGLNSAFQNTAITSVDLSSLTTVITTALFSAFRACTSLVSVDLSGLTTIQKNGAQYAFHGCTSLVSISLPSLTSIDGGALYSFVGGCTNIEDVYFPALTTSSFGSAVNQLSNMLSQTGINKTHTLHFPSNLEEKIQSLTGYPNFGGTSGYVVLSFDLPETS